MKIFKHIRKLIYIVMPALMLFGCFNNTDENSLNGRYNFNTNKLDVINLYKDHHYSHTYVNSKGKVFKNQGKWKYNGKEILFHDFNFFNDLGPAGGPGIWMSRVTKDDWRIKLNYSDDDDTYFEKK